MTVTALGFPAITVVTTTSQAANNNGDDEGANTQTTSADVKPDVDASVVPSLNTFRRSPSSVRKSRTGVPSGKQKRKGIDHEAIPVAPPHYPATSKDGTTTVTGYCSSSGEDADCRMKLVHPSGDIIVPFKATKL